MFRKRLCDNTFRPWTAYAYRRRELRFRCRVLEQRVVFRKRTRALSQACAEWLTWSLCQRRLRYCESSLNTRLQMRRHVRCAADAMRVLQVQIQRRLHRKDRVVLAAKHCVHVRLSRTFVALIPSTIGRQDKRAMQWIAYSERRALELAARLETVVACLRLWTVHARQMRKMREDVAWMHVNSQAAPKLIGESSLSAGSSLFRTWKPRIDELQLVVNAGGVEETRDQGLGQQQRFDRSPALERERSARERLTDEENEPESTPSVLVTKPGLTRWENQESPEQV